MNNPSSLSNDCIISLIIDVSYNTVFQILLPKYIAVSVTSGKLPPARSIKNKKST